MMLGPVRLMRDVRLPPRYDIFALLGCYGALIGILTPFQDNLSVEDCFTFEDGTDPLSLNVV